MNYSGTQYYKRVDGSLMVGYQIDAGNSKNYSMVSWKIRQ